MNRHGRWRMAPLLLIAALAPPVSLSGQKPPPRVSGQVIELETGTPIAEVLIEVLGTRGGTLSDSLGRFVLPRETSGRVRLNASRLGYVDVVRELDVWGGVFVTITMRPRPLLIEGIKVRLDRLERRNNATPYASSAYVERELRTSPARDAADFLARRDPSFRFIPCPGELDLDKEVFPGTCVLIRNRPVTLKIFVDEWETVGGLEELRSYDMRDLYRVELYPHCAQIWVYTRWFMEDVARARSALRPIVCFARG